MPVNPAKPVTRNEQAQKLVRPYARLLVVMALAVFLGFEINPGWPYVAAVLVGIYAGFEAATW